MDSRAFTTACLCQDQTVTGVPPDVDPGATQPLGGRRGGESGGTRNHDRMGKAAQIGPTSQARLGIRYRMNRSPVGKAASPMGVTSVIGGPRDNR